MAKTKELKTKKYALLYSTAVRYVELRETANYLIDDFIGEKYKKSVDTGNTGLVASNLKYTNWSWTGSDVYEVDSQVVKDKVEEIRKSTFLYRVKNAVRELNESLTYKKAIELNEALGLDVRY